MRQKRTKSNSDVQRLVERLAIVAVGTEFNVQLEPKEISLPDCKACVDGYYESPDGQTIYLVEVWAHVGKAIGSQSKKVLTDVLKMAFLADSLSTSRPNVQIKKYFVFVDEEAAKVLRSTGWGGAAARRFGIIPHVVKLEDQMRVVLARKQTEQDIRHGS